MLPPPTRSPLCSQAIFSVSVADCCPQLTAALRIKGKPFVNSVHEPGSPPRPTSCHPSPSRPQPQQEVFSGPPRISPQALRELCLPPGMPLHVLLTGLSLRYAASTPSWEAFPALRIWGYVMKISPCRIKGDRDVFSVCLWTPVARNHKVMIWTHGFLLCCFPKKIDGGRVCPRGRPFIYRPS